jgi:kynurenine formamidase
MGERRELDRVTAQGDVEADELGSGRHVTPEAILRALALVRQGRVFDLDPGRFPGMPRNPAQPPFDLVTYRSPRGERKAAELSFLQPETNQDNFGFVLEQVTTSMHMGAHIDALCHVTCGTDSEWYGGFSEAEFLGDKGALVSDVTRIPAIFARGVILDVAGHVGVPMLDAGMPIAAELLQATASAQGVELRAGDVVLIRTGQLRDWPEMRDGPEAGLSLDAAEWLGSLDPLAIGADNSAIEVLPSVLPRSPQPVHVHLLAKLGIYLLEWLALDELADAKPSEFLFVCLPLKITGATGSLVRPVAIL